MANSVHKYYLYDRKDKVLRGYGRLADLPISNYIRTLLFGAHNGVPYKEGQYIGVHGDTMRKYRDALISVGQSKRADKIRGGADIPLESFELLTTEVEPSPDITKEPEDISMETFKKVTDDPKLYARYLQDEQTRGKVSKMADKKKKEHIDAWLKLGATLIKGFTTWWKKRKLERRKTLETLKERAVRERKIAETAAKAAMKRAVAVDKAKRAKGKGKDIPTPDPVVVEVSVEVPAAVEVPKELNEISKTVPASVDLVELLGGANVTRSDARELWNYIRQIKGDYMYIKESLKNLKEILESGLDKGGKSPLSFLDIPNHDRDETQMVYLIVKKALSNYTDRPSFMSRYRAFPGPEEQESFLYNTYQVVREDVMPEVLTFMGRKNLPVAISTIIDESVRYLLQQLKL